MIFNNEEIVKQRAICVFYLTATCNLKCRYCYIDKSEILTKIDKILEESYKGNYYFNFMKEMFPDPNQLKTIEFWGGEPSYGLHRVIPTIKSAIKYYPLLHDFTMSTNLTTDIGLQDFFDFLLIFKDFPERKFVFNLQLSLDGPTAINDLNRGEGTTKKFTQHFSELLFKVSDILDNIPNLFINAYFKPTLDASSIAQLQTKEAVINYFKFFEKYKMISDQYVTSTNWSLSIPNPNTATPSPHTVQDGKNFANFISICKDIVIKENMGRPYFKYPRNIVPFADCRPCCSNALLTGGCGTCGSGSIVVGLLPNHLISSCHSGFVDLLSDYRQKCEEQKDLVDRTIDFEIFLNKGIKNKALHTLSEYQEYEKQMQAFNMEARFQVAELASLIQLYAFAGQIDSKYSDQTEAILAAHFIHDHTAACVRDNLGATGSKFLFQVGYLKLFLNGAKESIEDVEHFLVPEGTR